MEHRLTLAERMAGLQYWQILALGVLASLVTIFAVTFLAHLSYEWFPEAWGWVALGHLAAVGTAAWYVPRPFIHAYMIRRNYITWGQILALFPADPEND